jgi:hypothetical protein
MCLCLSRNFEFVILVLKDLVEARAKFMGVDETGIQKLYLHGLDALERALGRCSGW